MIELTAPTGAPPPELAARVATQHARLVGTFRAACEREQVHGALNEVEGGLELAFEPQETAPSELILDTFLTELERRGVRAGVRLAVPPRLADAEMDRVTSVFAETIRRLRALMIEYNSYLSAGLPWVFPGGAETLRARGLCIYRYPARGPVDVRPAEQAIRITFHPGPLGPITSSGFYVPTSVRGDFTASIRYRIRRWAPGPEAASLALFVQDEPSRVRYYALRQTEAGRTDRPYVRANLNDELSTKVRVAEPAGAFRLTRRGETIASWFRDGESGDEAAWTELAQIETGETPDLFVGAKIWSGAECDGLEADLFGLVIEGEIPTEQSPVLVERPDPRERG